MNFHFKITQILALTLSQMGESIPIILPHFTELPLSTVATGYSVSGFIGELVGYEDVFNWRHSVMTASSLCVPHATVDEAKTQERDPFSRFIQWISWGKCNCCCFPLLQAVFLWLVFVSVFVLYSLRANHMRLQMPCCLCNFSISGFVQ